MFGRRTGESGAPRKLAPTPAKAPTAPARTSGGGEKVATKPNEQSSASEPKREAPVAIEQPAPKSGTGRSEDYYDVKTTVFNAVSYTHLTLPTTPYV